MVMNSDFLTLICFVGALILFGCVAVAKYLPEVSQPLFDLRSFLAEKFTNPSDNEQQFGKYENENDGIVAAVNTSVSQITVDNHNPHSNNNDPHTPGWNWFEFCMRMDTHIMLVGKTGAGKSTLAMALCIARSHIGKVVILDPHAKDTDWQGLPVIGKGRNYEAIGQAMIALLEELDKRYNSEEYRTNKVLEPLTIFVDELPRCTQKINHALEFLQTIAMEGRKVNMRLICLTQSYLVKTLKLEGQGDTRDNFITTFLGKHAVRLIPALANTEWPAVMDIDGDLVPIKRSFIARIVASQCFETGGVRYISMQTDAIWHLPPEYRLGSTTIPDSVPGSGSRESVILRSKSWENKEPEPLELSELEERAIIALHHSGLNRSEIATVLKGRRQDRLRQIAGVLQEVAAV